MNSRVPMSIYEFDLDQIKADVVIVLFNDTFGHHRIIPYWECEIPALELKTHAAHAALVFAEQCGGGYVDFHIRDYREDAASDY